MEVSPPQARHPELHDTAGLMRDQTAAEHGSSRRFPRTRRFLRTRRFFSETVTGTRNLTLLMYALISPIALLVMLLLSAGHPHCTLLLATFFVLCLTGFLWTWRSKGASMLRPIYGVSVAPTLCCATAAIACGDRGLVFLVAMAAPMVSAAAMFRRSVPLVGWITATACMSVAILLHGNPPWVALSSTLVFATIAGLVTWLVFLKASHLRALLAHHQATEEELRSREESYRNQFMRNASMMLLFDPQTGEILEANESAQEFYGYDRATFLSMTIDQLNTLGIDEIRRQIELIREGFGKRFEFVHRLADGSLREVESSVTWILFQGRQVFHDIVVDITERKQAQRLAASSVERLQLATNAGGVGIWDCDIAHDRIVWDEQMHRLYGTTPESFAGTAQAWNAFIHPQDQERSRHEIERILSGNGPVDCEYRILRPDGQVRHIHARSETLRGPDGTPIRAFGTNWDITDLKESMARIAESEEKFNRIFQSNPALMAITSLPDRRFVDVNAAFLSALGFEREEILGRSAMELGMFVDLEAYERNKHFLLETGSLHDLELKVRAKDGRIIDGIFSGEIVVSSGKPFLLTIMVDITARKAAERELERTVQALHESTATAHALAEKATKASRIKNDFLATMSHEIRTPMNGILGMTSLLLNTPLAPDQARFAHTVRKSGEALQEIVNDILDFSRIESGKLVLEAVDFDLGVLLEDFADTLALQASEKSLDWNCVLGRNVPHALRGDSGRLRQILMNLAGNALKFTVSGEVAVDVSVCERSASDVLLRFEIRDTGIGIPADKLGLLFDKFTQLDSSMNRRFGGTGLGLALSKELASLMGGEIGVVSAEGKGSTFWFTARLALQAVDEISSFAVPDEFQGRRILIVDDNATARVLLERLVSSFGMFPTCVPDGPSALHAIYGTPGQVPPFDAVLVDRYLPGMDGAILCRNLRSDRRMDSMRLILTTSISRQGDADGFGKEDFDGILPKPIHAEELRWLLQDLLDRDATPSSFDLVMETSKAVLRERSPAERKPLRILVVDDNTINLTVAREMLAKLGYTAETALGGEEALQQLSSIPFDLILLDCQMPGMDGYEFTRVVRGNPTLILDSTIPILAVTANATLENRERCLAAGMDDFIAKPISLKVLREKIEQWTLVRRDRESVKAAEPLREPDILTVGQLIVRLEGDAGLAAMILGPLPQTLDGKMEELYAALASDDLATVRALLHLLKGMTANTDCNRLSRLLASMERDLPDLDLLKSREPLLRATVASTTEAIHAWLATRDG